ncbi:PIR Superfamily Protein [Plasmodium ovale wallikeri]|uniref:PIR Superfamily Protein n=1 Tax=Plasmodium ovale wallikeri TaxID=864142 RepID=A0A1A9AGI8_PLAOA|nr:PIR Superfamily Protein [Plasmodium ovale wallikeri]SBT59197.1 PIR Superfamily Protein [Plasmodium ovale wallikeri]
MIQKINDHILGDWDNKYKSLMKLPLKRIYKKFNDYYSYTRSENTNCSSSISVLSPHDTLLLPVCHKIGKILESSNSIVSLYDSIDVNKYCVYLSYFLYDQIKDNSTYNNVQVLYDTLNKIKKNYGLNDDCNIINFNINIEQFDNKKELYFHGEILNWIKSESAAYDSNDSQIFSKYFSECVDSYEKIIHNNYCDYIQHYNEELDIFLSNFKETKIALEKKHIGITAKDISLIDKPKCTSEEGDGELVREKAVAQDTDYQALSTMVSSDTETTQMDSLDTGTDITSGLVFGIITGIFFLFLLFYKFSPFGTWIHRKIGIIRKNINLDVKNNEFIEDTFDNEDINLYDDTYHMKYHSSENI